MYLESREHWLHPGINTKLQQSCSANLQACNKFDMRRAQVSNKFAEATNLQQACHFKLIANYSKNRVRTQPRIRTRDRPLPKMTLETTRTLDYERRR
ncbi:hypothetical protein AVEN_218762-1 [Araneus ventricosus]|uniref:Uncharacterized protein n=1 Tax=Araneus ventricosus TaxID=182803 RepID=A0A4Y2B6Z8_ARAVE|nr:hypothetical protein AVEN_218762-1 [Araneus ventricosus]